MAHFAELDGSNIVLRVIVIDNDEVIANGGDESTQAEEYVKNLVGLSENGVVWKQTSYNNNFRKSYANGGMVYDGGRDIFRPEQPHPSWALDGNNDWQAPVAYPTVLEYDWDDEGKAEVVKAPYYINWDESESEWIATSYPGSDDTRAFHTWNASTLLWEND